MEENARRLNTKSFAFKHQSFVCHGGVFSTLSNIYDATYCKNNQRFKPLTYIIKDKPLSYSFRPRRLNYKISKKTSHNVKGKTINSCK